MSERTTSPYYVGYLAAHNWGTRRLTDGLLVAVPPHSYVQGSPAHQAFAEGCGDSADDRAPRKPFHRVSRAYPPWRQI